MMDAPVYEVEDCGNSWSIVRVLGVAYVNRTVVGAYRDRCSADAAVEMLNQEVKAEHARVRGELQSKQPQPPSGEFSRLLAESQVIRDMQRDDLREAQANAIIARHLNIIDALLPAAVRNPASTM